MSGCCASILQLTAGTAEGITEPFRDVQLGLAVPGIIVKRLVNEGDFVSTNQVILQLDNRLEELEAARRKLLVENRRTDFEATRQLFENSKSVSKDELDKKEVEYRVAEVDYLAALEQVRRRQLLAPEPGVVVEILREVGEVCDEYQPLIHLVDVRQAYFTCNLEASDAARLRLGQAAKVQIAETPQPVTVTGEVTFISPVVDAASGLQKVRILFNNAEARIRPGLSGRLVLE